MESIENLISRVYSIQVLKFVYFHPGSNQNIIIAGEGKTTKLKRLKEFVDADLIKEVEVAKNQTNKLYYLTLTGEKFVKNWLLIESGEDIEPINHDAPSAEGNHVKS